MKKTAFTLMELLTVVTIIGIITAFAVPNYSKAMGRAREKNVINNMQLIYAAQAEYVKKNGIYWDAPDVATINQGLGLNIVLDPSMVGSSYMCTARSYQEYACVFGWPSKWSVQLTDFPYTGVNPCCLGTTCPTLPDCGH